MSQIEHFSADALHHYVAGLCEAAERCGFRAVVVLSGEMTWCREQAAALLAARKVTDSWWLGAQAVAGTTPLAWSHARTRLGMELEQLVIDAFDGFDAEGFGALSGTVRAGGLLLLLSPPLDRWCHYADPLHRRFALYPHPPESVTGHFLARLAKVLRGIRGIALVAQGEPLPELPSLPQSRGRVAIGEVYAGAEQCEAVKAIRHVAEGHPHRPLVLSADRGRGKSAALGIAAAQLLHKGLEQVVVTAPRIAAAAGVFEHARELLPECEAHRGRLLWQGRSIEFVPPDALLLAPRAAQLLLVDEAAAIPTPILERLLDYYPRTVFATTIHGYEGTGRGFSVRFSKVLDVQTPQWRRLHLSMPVRWSAGDPLEQLSFRVLLLDAEAVADEVVAGASPANCEISQLDGATLLDKERDLSELFGLLVLAHYRTSPNDLRQLLDGPQQSLYVLRHAGHIIATALVVEEGELEPELAQQVYLGRRRVQGHLLPQSLANHAGFVEAATLRGARVMRIAVHPALQGRGLGGLLLGHVQQAMQRKGCDYLGASFGATVQLLRFWQQQGLLPVRLGLRREASSGSHSVMVMAPLSKRGGALFLAVWERFCETLPELLAGPLDTLDGVLADRLLELAPPIVHEAITRQDRRDLESFAFGLRGYELCLVAIRKLVLQALGDRHVLAKLDTARQQLLRDKVVQRHSWERVVDRSGFSGRKEALERLRETVALLVRHYFGGAGLPGG
ncbi:MAG: GNAT family N-acetyltransferase [Gammaproteobacteria bacterium]|nr:GNAT family N-acetyltransferase [Gammaproteobacteria bacterium]